MFTVQRLRLGWPLMDSPSEVSFDILVPYKLDYLLPTYYTLLGHKTKHISMFNTS